MEHIGERPIIEVGSHHIRDFNQSEAEILGGALDASYAEAVENELIKTPEETKIIDYFNTYLSEEFQELGLGKYQDFPPEKIHLLKADDFKTNFSKISLDTDYGFYSPNAHAAFINKEKAASRLNLLRSIVHEMVHAASFRLYQETKDEKEKVFENYKLGYRSNKFSGLNEATVDLFSYRFFLNNQAKLMADFNISQAEWDDFKITSYRDYCLLADNIMEVITQKNNEPKSAVWKRFKLGLFSGSMMHLREVETALAPGALRQLAELGYDDEADKKILESLNKLVSEKQNKDQQ